MVVMVMKCSLILDEEKIIEVILYIAHNIKLANFHTLSKVMYFADRIHLENYGRFICNDDYVAMKHGPVPSKTYDILKSVRDDGFTSVVEPARKAFSVDKKNSLIKPLRDTDLDLLSDSDLECLQEAIRQYGHLSFEELTKRSHDAAWDSANENDFMEIEQIIATFPNSQSLLEHLRNPHP